MKVIGLLLIAAFTLVLMTVTGCDKKPKLMPNTEAYIQAHGIEPGKVNTLQIGGTLFQFPAGVGLNPYTSDPEKIVKGHADKVTLYLNSKNNYAPKETPSLAGDVRITISKYGSPPRSDRLQELTRNMPIVIHYPEFGLMGYRSNKPQFSGSVLVSTLPQFQKSIDGGRLFFGCQGIPPSKPGDCGTSYWVANGRYSVAIGTGGTSYFLKHWREIYTAGVQFVNSVVVK